MSRTLRPAAPSCRAAERQCCDAVRCNWSACSRCELGDLEFASYVVGKDRMDLYVDLLFLKSGHEGDRLALMRGGLVETGDLRNRTWMFFALNDPPAAVAASGCGESHFLHHLFDWSAH